MENKQKMLNNSRSLLVSEPGPLCSGLHAVLNAISDVTTVALKQGTSATLDAVSSHRPALLLMNPNSSTENVCEIVKQVKRRSPKTNCVVLTKRMQNRSIIEAAGADKVLLKGTNAAQLVNVLEGMLAQ